MNLRFPGPTPFMGGESNVTVALRRVRESKGLMRRLVKLEKDLGLK